MKPLAVIKGLEKTYSPFVTALTYTSEWQLLVAIILSAQCTDAQVNKVTPTLFKVLPTIDAMASARLPSIEKLIFSTGFYKNKAKNLKAAAKKIVEEFGGTIPGAMDKLVTIPGVGRKTANVFLHVVHKKSEGVVVDTHIYRVSRRTGVSKANTPQGVERDVMKELDRKYWIVYGNLVIQHGRQICFARKPNCTGCPLNKECPSAFRIT